VKAMGIKEVLSAPRSPWQHAYVERVIGTIRRECLDPVIVLSEASLSVVDIDGKTFRIKQVSETGDVADTFRIAK